MPNPNTETLEYFVRLLPPGKEWFTPKEVAAILPWGERFVRDCLKDRRMLGHSSCAPADAGGERRQSLAVPRAALVLFLAETANYTSTDLLYRFCEVVGAWPPGMQRALRDFLNEELEDDHG